MAEKQLEIELLLKDKEALARLKSAFDQMESSGKKFSNNLALGFTELNSAISLIERAATPFINFMDASIHAAIAQEDAINRLNFALKNQGTFTAELSQRYQDMASELQNSTRFADDAINMVQQRLVAIGNVGPANMERVTKAVLDFSTATGKDLEASAMAFAKAANGNTAALQKMGVQIDEHLPKAEKFSAALDLVEKKFGGAAQADINSYAGATAKLGNAWGDFQEEIGNFIIKNPGVVQGIKDIENSISSLTSFLKENKTAVDQTISALAVFSEKGAIGLGQNILESTKGLDAAMTGMQGVMSGIFSQGPSVLEMMFGGPEAQAAVFENVAATGEIVKEQQTLLETELAQIKAVFGETELAQKVSQEQMKIDAERQLVLAWYDEKQSYLMAKQQEETEFNKLALDAMKKSHESFWPTVGKLRDQFAAGTSKMLTDAITGTANWGEAFKQLGKQMIQSLIEYGIQLAINAALAKALQSTAVAAALISGKAMATAYAPAAALASLASFGANAVPAAAGMTAVLTQALAAALIPGLADGGTVTSPGTVLVGERGPEFLDLPAGASVTPLDKAGPQIHVVIHLNNAVVGSEEIAQKLGIDIGRIASEFISVELQRL